MEEILSPARTMMLTIIKITVASYFTFMAILFSVSFLDVVSTVKTLKVNNEHNSGFIKSKNSHILSSDVIDVSSRKDIQKSEDTPNILFEYEDVLIYDIFGVGYYDNINKNYVYYNINSKVLLNFLYFCILVLLLLIVKTLLMLKVISKDKRDFLKTVGGQSKIESETFSMLSENIHHELKTPLVVITNVLEDIKENIYNVKNYIISKETLNSTDKFILSELGVDTLKCETSCSLDKSKTDEMLSMIDTHINVIYNLLERMADFKNTKSSGDKNIYEILEISFKTLDLFTKNNFEYKIDTQLHGFKVSNGLTNEDLINIFINHIKNSLEANSTYIEVLKVKQKDGILYIQILDNGGGIPETSQDKIFKNKFSTKDATKNSRGVGLYLCKTTLESFGGDDILLETNENGTSFGINIPIDVVL